MPKRIRDYKAEEARRNELARQRGFTTRAAERGARERKDWEKAGYATHKDYISARAKARSWSELHSNRPASAFNPRFSPQQTKDYLTAFRVEKDKKHAEYIRDLADYLHGIDPEAYPDYDSDPEFWNGY